MPVKADREADILSVYISDIGVLERREVAGGIIAGYDPNGRVVALEIHHASKRKNTLLSRVVQSLDEVKRVSGNLTKQPHYVWAFHLRAWADTEGKVRCFWLRQNKFGSPAPESIAKQSFFYRTHRLSEGDMTYLNWLTNKASLPGLREINRSTITFFQEIYDLEYLLEELDLGGEGKAVFREHINFAERMLGERYHGAIEVECKPFLEKLRLRDASFADHLPSFHKFIFYLSQQLFRTAKMRKTILAAFKHTPIAGHDPRRTGHIEQHIYANNVSAGMVAESERYKITFLCNNSNFPFITADQPVINTITEGSDDMNLYYPITPETAIVVSTDKAQTRQVGDLEVEALNHKIFQACEDQVYSNREEYLRGLVAIGKLDLNSS